MGNVLGPDRWCRQKWCREDSAAEHFAGRYTRLEFRFRDQLCYVGAYTRPDGERAEAQTPLCRLRYFGEERWSFSFYNQGRYILGVAAKKVFCTPEQALEVSARRHLLSAGK